MWPATKKEPAEGLGLALREHSPFLPLLAVNQLYQNQVRLSSLFPKFFREFLEGHLDYQSLCPEPLVLLIGYGKILKQIVLPFL